MKLDKREKILINQAAYRGLIIFTYLFVISLIISIIINLNFYDEISKLIVGSLGEKTPASLASTLQMTIVFMNLIVLNSSHGFRFGLLMLLFLPSLIIWLVAKIYPNPDYKGKYKHIYFFSSSLVFSLLLLAFSLVTAGQLIGIDFNYFNFNNFIITFLIIYILQFVIGSLKKVASRPILRTNLIYITLMAIVCFILIYTRWGIGRSKVLILPIIFILPNLVFYVISMSFGIGIDFSEGLIKLMNYLNFDPSFASLPIVYRIVTVSLFFLLIFYCANLINKKSYYKNSVKLLLSYMIIFALMARLTEINLGFVKNLLDVRFNIPLGPALIIPSLIIVAILILVDAFRRLKIEFLRK